MTSQLKAKKIKYLTIAIAVVLCLFAIITFLMYNHLENQRIDREAVTFTENLTISFNTPAKISDFIAQLNGELIEDQAINTTTLGKQTVKFDFFNLKHKKRTRELTINIIDDLKPQIYGNSTYTVYQGYKGELTDLMMSVDDRDDHPKREILGKYDLEQPGTYQLTYKITDDHHNSSEKNFTLQVIEPPASSSNQTWQLAPSTASGTPIAEIIEQYQTHKTKIGIDVSEWQGKIDWSKVKQAGVEFAFIRLGYQANYGGELVLDPYFKSNIEAALAAKIPVGVYFFSYANSTTEAENQANWIIEQIKPYQLDLGIAFDWENWQNFNQANLSQYSLGQVAQTFINTVQDKSYQGLLYSSKNYLDLIWRPEQTTIWLAQYYHKPTYEGDFTFWQLSDQGQVDGINGFVDLNLWYPD